MSMSMHLMTDFKFERSLNDLFCDFAADILITFIVCANKKADLPQFQDEMIRFPSRCLKEIKSYRIKLFVLLNIIHKNRVGIYF